MLDLVKPTTRLHATWLDAHDDWGPGFHEDGFGLQPTDEVTTASGFAAWVERLRDEPSPDTSTTTVGISCRYRWILEDDNIVGGIMLRYGVGGMLDRTGNIGYGIKPSARGRGVATWALGQMITEARSIGMTRVLVVCGRDNVASAKTIEANGGVLQVDTVAATGSDAMQRYWIETTESPRKNFS